MAISTMIGRLARATFLTTALAVPALTSVPGEVRAQYLVKDVQNIAQEIRQIQQMLEDYGIQTDQLNKLLEQIELLQTQIDQLKETYAALSGPTEIAKMVMENTDLNGLLDQEFGDMIGLAQGVANGDFSGLLGSAAPEMQSQMKRVLAEAGFGENTLQEMATSGNRGAENVATRASTGAVMAAAAQNSHREAAQSLERVNELVCKIPEMETLKASVDHNTRVTAELAIAMTRMWELEAIQTVGAGQGGVVDAATMAEEQRYMDFTLPDLD